MIFTIEEARDILRIDGGDNDAIIEPLIDAIPPYLEATTGYAKTTGDYSPVARAAGRFLLQLWYYGENADADKLQRVIDCLLKALSAERVRVSGILPFGGMAQAVPGVPAVKELYLRTLRSACRNRPSPAIPDAPERE